MDIVKRKQGITTSTPLISRNITVQQLLDGKIEHLKSFQLNLLSVRNGASSSCFVARLSKKGGLVSFVSIIRRSSRSACFQGTRGGKCPARPTKALVKIN
jgi:hypothetical protein